MLQICINDGRKKKIKIEDNDVRNYENILNRKKCKIKDKIKKRKKKLIFG